MNRITSPRLPVFSVISLLIVLMLLFTLPINAKRKNCPHPASAILTGSTNIGPPGMQFKVNQTIIAAKNDAKKGSIGKWVATEWDYTQVSPRSSSPAIAKVAMAAVNTMPTVRIPGISAKCTTLMTNARTVSWHCVGKYPFEIDANGDIRAGNQRIGTFSKGSEKITLSVIPMNPMFRSTVQGLVQKRNTIGIIPKFTSVRYKLDSNRVAYKLNISLKSQNKGAENALRAKAVYTGKDPRLVSITSKKEGSKVHFTIILKSLSQARRSQLASDITITANTVFHGCPISQKWDLIDLLFTIGDRY